MTDEQKLHLILTEYYVKEKGLILYHQYSDNDTVWYEEHDEHGQKLRFIDRECKLTDLKWLAELLRMLAAEGKVVSIKIYPKQGKWDVMLFGSLFKSVTATADTIELALAECLCEIIKEKK